MKCIIFKIHHLRQIKREICSTNTYNGACHPLTVPPVDSVDNYTGQQVQVASHSLLDSKEVQHCLLFPIYSGDDHSFLPTIKTAMAQKKRRK